jgi:hypothetical protein
MDQMSEFTVCDGFAVAVATCLMTSASVTSCVVIEPAAILLTL